LAIKSQRKDFTLTHYLRNKKEIRWYCIEDCRLTKQLAEHWLNTFQKQFGFLLRSWVSSGYCAEKVLINNDIFPPYFNDIEYQTQDIAWKAFYGGRFELITKGFIGTCYLYDINSAYPYALTLLPDILDGTWIDDSNKINPQAALGFFCISANIDNTVKIAPFPFRTKNGKMIYPIGKFITYVTLEELKVVKGDSRIKYEILDSWQFIPNKNCRYPFKQFIEEQFYKRLELKEKKDPLEQAIKVVLNSIYGKMAQRINNRMGNLFNPVISAFITGYTRAQLYRFMREHDLERSVVAFATDSIAVTKKIDNLDSKRLGEMKLDKQADDVIFLSNGFYRFNGKWKQRGIGYDNEKKVEISHLDTRIDDYGQLCIMVETTKTTHIKSSILYNRIKSIGKIEQYEKRIGLNSDKKRFWLKELKSLNAQTL
jgi:DNA polymerase family B